MINIKEVFGNVEMEIGYVVEDINSTIEGKDENEIFDEMQGIRKSIDEILYEVRKELLKQVEAEGKKVGEYNA